MLKNLKEFKLADIEEKVLEYWKTNQIFEKTLKTKEKGERFVFYEGPPTANGRPGIHHILGRVFKDIILRYKTMRGYYVPRRAGWDTHGLPVEIEVEKELGIKNKKDIEQFGIGLFNQKAKEVVWKYKDEWEKMTNRIGFWLDLKNAYATYENYYIESLWWVLSQISNKGLLRKDYKVVPYCPRCQTVLASHELGQPGVYKKVKDPSIYIKFKIKNKTNEYLLVWTTTPWTLPANVAIAVNSGVTYTKYAIKKSFSTGAKLEYIWSINPPPTKEDYSIEAVEKISGKKLIGLEYEPLYKTSHNKLSSDNSYRVYSADFVLVEDGTGFVHIAPAFGVDDFNLIKSSVDSFSYQNIPVTVDDDGNMVAGFPGAHKFIKSADNDIIADLEKRGLMYKSEKQEHEYPFCWRCSTPLIYFARTAWFIEVSKLRPQLLSSNKKINWIPEHIKEGRFGEWIKEAKDWAISRQRYWGTPLPVWSCEDCGIENVIQGLSELNEHDYYGNEFMLQRHTEALHNVKDIVASGPKGKIEPLTEKGKKEAIEIAKKLKGKIDVIYSSPYKRALELAKEIGKASDIKVIVDKRIEEANAGIFNEKPTKEHKAFFDSPSEEFTKTPPGGENLTDIKKRVFGFIREINKLHVNKRILIVSHGDPLWMMEGAMKNFSNEEMLAMDYIRVGESRKVKLNNWPYNTQGELDMHRPFIDEVVLKCKKCNGKMMRIKEVADVWFDSGAMPLASAHYPFAVDNKYKKSNPLVKDDRRLGLKEFPYPADFICEAIDQTRGWFYTLLTVGTLLGHKEPPFKNVICLGLINDKFGQKMSKSKGNVVNPWDVIAKYGVDAIRWYFYTINAPGETKNFDEIDIKKVQNRVFNILYNSFVFYEMYADKSPIPVFKNLKSKHILDKWILASLNKTILKVTEELEKYEVGNAAKAIEELIDNLSRWYIRRSRRRLQRPEDNNDFKDCSATLGFAILEIAKLMAPFAPFFGESIYKSLNLSGEHKDSIHIEDWPVVSKKHIDNNLLENMHWVRSLATEALAKRAEAGIKVRQPLSVLYISKKSDASKIVKEKELISILKEEINVKEIKISDTLKDVSVELDTKITPELREEGILREFIRLVQELRQKAELQPKNKIEIYLDSKQFGGIIERHSEEFIKQVGATKLNLKRTNKIDAEIETKIEESDVWVGLKSH